MQIILRTFISITQNPNQDTNYQCLISKSHQTQKRNTLPKCQQPSSRFGNKRRNQSLYKQEEINHLHSLKLEQQKMEKQIYVNLKKENQQPKTNEKREEPVKPVKSSTTAKIKGDKYSEYGLFENGAFTCLKCQSRVKRTQDLLKHWTMQHGRQAIPRRKRNFVNEDTQCVKKISQETLKSEAQSDL
ncbi:unnamed protein product (macronuclear) [Paramecium tetraurelia]|uniref:C2H2-type domain-containing protein n=1 Tax=Paramecium tetraurelia TaxID=5888 RepID=A0C9L3_PARTE|nr:uncharacterized protein GSPATT00006786001 [Paramecium tetraurelia]CAK67480.1 unnamed protein product [Paramecium tetraurelia]|eukprot:XP_001434877.1 hypothetical protein (macronuclear) [Paramecium tetraurelia strain d4-2]